MTDKEKIDNEEHYVKPPSFFQMAKSFTKELATYVKNGAPNVTEEDYQARLDTCKECEFLIEKTMRCGSCGCLLEHKAKWKTSDCPKKKWEPQELSKEQQDKINEDKEKQKADVKPPKEMGNYYYDNQNGNKIFTSMPTKPDFKHEFIPKEKIEERRQKNAEKLKNAKRQKDNNTDSSD